MASSFFGEDLAASFRPPSRGRLDVPEDLDFRDPPA
jgi:hypothetical protein